MKMKKLIALLLSAVMLLALAACSSGNGDNTTPTDTGSAPSDTGSAPSDTGSGSAPVDLTLATYPIGKWSDESVVNGLIADFNAVYPDIHITVQYLTYESGDDTVNAAIEAETAPDIIFEGPERLVANWGAKGYLVDLKDLVLPSMYSTTVASCTSTDGAVYELPVVQTAHCMAINRNLFEAAGAWQYVDEATYTWTTEDFINAVNALTAYGQENVGIVFCRDQGGDQGTRALVTNLYGGTFANAEHTQYTANCPENVQALEMLRNLKGINFDAAAVGSDEIQFFCNGTLAMAFCWNVTQEVNNAENISFDVFPMAFPTNSGDPILQGGIWGFGVFNNGDEAKIEAAKTFIKFMTENDAQYAKAVEAANYWPVRDVAGLYEGDELMTEYGLLAPFLGDYYQVTLGWTTARTEWWNALQRIGAGGDVATELNTFVENANAAAAG